MLPAASQPTSVGRLNTYGSAGGAGVARRRGRQPFDGLGPAAEHHHDAALGVELDDHVRPLVHGPDVVLRIDAHRVRELEAVEALRRSRGRSCRSRRTRTGGCRRCACRRRCALGIGRDADALAEVEVRRHLQEIRHRFVRDLRHVLGLGLALGEDRSGPGVDEGQGEEKDAGSMTAPHERLRRQSIPRKNRGPCHAAIVSAKSHGRTTASCPAAIVSLPAAPVAKLHGRIPHKMWARRSERHVTDDGSRQPHRSDRTGRPVAVVRSARRRRRDLAAAARRLQPAQLGSALPVRGDGVRADDAPAPGGGGGARRDHRRQPARPVHDPGRARGLFEHHGLADRRGVPVRARVRRRRASASASPTTSSGASAAARSGSATRSCWPIW